MAANMYSAEEWSRHLQILKAEKLATDKFNTWMLFKRSERLHVCLSCYPSSKSGA